LTFQVLFAILSAVALIAVIMLIFLPNVHSYESQSKNNDELSVPPHRRLHRRSFPSARPFPSFFVPANSF